MRNPQETIPQFREGGFLGGTSDSVGSSVRVWGLYCETLVELKEVKLMPPPPFLRKLTSCLQTGRALLFPKFLQG